MGANGAAEVGAVREVDLDAIGLDAHFADKQADQLAALDRGQGSGRFEEVSSSGPQLCRRDGTRAEARELSLGGAERFTRADDLRLRSGEGGLAALVLHETRFEQLREQRAGPRLGRVDRRPEGLDVSGQRLAVLEGGLCSSLGGSVDHRWILDHLGEEVHHRGVEALRGDQALGADDLAGRPRARASVVVVAPATAVRRGRRERAATAAADPPRQQVGVRRVVTPTAQAGVRVHDALGRVKDLLGDDRRVAALVHHVQVADLAQVHHVLQHVQHRLAREAPALAASLRAPRAVAQRVEPVRDLGARLNLEVAVEELHHQGRLILHRAQRAIARAGVAERGAAAVPEAPLGPRVHRDTGTLSGVLALQLSQRHHHPGQQLPRGRRRVVLLTEGVDPHVVLTEQLLKLEKVQQ